MAFRGTLEADERRVDYPLRRVLHRAHEPGHHDLEKLDCGHWLYVRLGDTAPRTSRRCTKCQPRSTDHHQGGTRP